jgi:hypothetical protein
MTTMNDKLHDAASLKGLTITSIKRVSDDGDDSIKIATSDGRQWDMRHYQDCCESVRIEKIAGSLDSLIGSPLIEAREETDSEGWPADAEPKEYTESYTWTTYYFATDSASVSIRWLGESNGYYSESVSIEEVAP